jgi:hypothetical protein
MSTKKTIQINPELFKLPSNKTRKTREKKELSLVPIVSPNNLKNKLLKRIKEHKTKEFSSKINENIVHNQPQIESNNNYDDEFYGAINYLSDLAKKNKNDVERERYQRSLNNKTLKQWSPQPNNVEKNIGLYVSSNLPPELETQPEYFVPDKNTNAISLKYKPDEEIPYGCLKGGVKPSYKSWVQTRKNYEHPELENISMIRPPTPPKRNTYVENFSQPTQPQPQQQPIKNTINELSREQRLEQIRHKLRILQEQENKHKPEYSSLKKDLNNLEPIINKNVLDDLPELDGGTRTTFAIPEILQPEKKNDVPKKYIKKVIKRKFTLGKSTKMRKVGILIKDNKTRKNIINAQKELKKTNMVDTRKYLRKHGMNKVGSVAPPELLRAMFENAMMAGDIRNTNKDTLLHNFINDNS